MEQKIQKWNKLLEVLFEYPLERFKLRQLEKKTKIPPSTLVRYLSDLTKEGILDKKRHFVNNSSTRWRKTAHLIDRLFASGLLTFLEQKLKPATIVLFGSVRKGEYDHTSDIDIFIVASEQKIDISSFEKKLGHKIHVIMKPRLRELPEELRLSIINGIKLSGYLTL